MRHHSKTVHQEDWLVHYIDIVLLNSKFLKRICLDKPAKTGVIGSCAIVVKLRFCITFSLCESVSIGNRGASSYYFSPSIICFGVDNGLA